MKLGAGRWMAKVGPNELRKLLVKSLRGTPEDAETFRQAAKASTQDHPSGALKRQAGLKAAVISPSLITAGAVVNQPHPRGGLL